MWKMGLKLFLLSLLLISCQDTKADQDRWSFDTKRSPGSPFKIGDFSLSTRTDVLSQCDFKADGLTRIEPYQQEFSCPEVAYWKGSFCISTDKTCLSRNITCCLAFDSSMESFGLGFEGNELTICKSDLDGWKALLHVDVPVLESSNPGINLLNNVTFQIGGIDDAILGDGFPFKINLTREYSTLPTALYNKIESGFNAFCAQNDTNCDGIRLRNLEESTGFFACYSPPASLTTTTRSWLEQNFPVMQIKLGSSNSSDLCVSPWSYFVPIAQNKYCIGIVSSRTDKFELGLNLVEGNTISFLNGGVIARVANYSKCAISSMCTSSAPTDMVKSTTTPSPSEETLFTDPPSTNTPTPQRTFAPTRPKATLRPSKRRPDDDIGQVGFDDIGQTNVEDGGSLVDDLDLSPWVWFGIGCGVTLFVNCILLVYCRYCRGSSEPKFSRLPANVEMTATSPTVQMTATTNVLPTTQSGASTKVPPTRESIIQNAAAPFEQNPIIPGGASAFEKSWNQGLIVDVWGITLKSWHQNVAVDTLTRLRLLRVASGTVSGVEKMYWVARQKQNGPSGAPILGMIEISVDLTTKRMSAVFKMSRSAGPSTSKDAKDLHSLFDAFKLVIEDTMC